jgi:hypothetical protein
MDVPKAETLEAYEGKTIAQICDGGYTDAGFNHCAHFVSHALGFSIGFTCKGMTGKGTSPATIRVHELFAHCPEVGKWDDFNGLCCLAFVIDRGNVNLKTKVMANVPRKHVGIYLDGTIWHYSNSKDKVVTQTPDDFRKHYKGSTIGLFYGTLLL